MHAIAHRVLEERPDARIVYVSAERFTNEFIEALQHHEMDEFRARYRAQLRPAAGRRHPVPRRPRADAGRVLPHVQRAARRRRADRRHERQVPAAAAAHAGAAGLALHVRAGRRHPGAAARDARRHRAQEGRARGHSRSRTTWRCCSRRAIQSNVRELEGALIRLAAKSSLTGRAHRLDFATSELALVAPRRADVMSVEDIQRAVCQPLPPLERGARSARIATRASPSRARSRCTCAGSG